jgi:exodeoxyribonuclease VII small subunit
MSNKFSYEKAMTELEKIIQDIQQEKVGLDELSDLILKARKLYSKCTEKLRSVEKEIANIENKDSEYNIEE